MRKLLDELKALHAEYYGDEDGAVDASAYFIEKGEQIFAILEAAEALVDDAIYVDYSEFGRGTLVDPEKFGTLEAALEP